MRAVAAIKAMILGGFAGLGYVVCKRDAYLADHERLARLEAAAAAEQRRADALAAEVGALNQTLNAERQRAARGVAVTAEIAEARRATARAERELEQARAELWAARHAPRHVAGD